MRRISWKAQWFTAGTLFVLCTAPTFIGYRPYTFRWDDSVYLHQAICLSRAFWSSKASGINHIREVRSALYGYGERPPAMCLLGLPWGPLSSWDAVGKCFFTLGCSIGFVAAACLFLLQRIGVRPVPFALACFCVGGTLGPWRGSQVNYYATAFMADTLFAWTSFAAVLLIPYEARTAKDSSAHALLRGAYWGAILSLGAMTKISFLYLDVLILPCLLLFRYRQHGLRNVGMALIGFLISAAPSILYLGKYGRSSVFYARASSFGNFSSLYGNSLSAFFHRNLGNSPGLWLFILGVIAAFAFILARHRSRLLNSTSIAVLIATGFEVIVLTSPNRDIRFSFPLIVCLPFLLAVLLTSHEKPVPRGLAAWIAACAFLSFCAVAWPTRHRAQRMDSLARADAVLSQASHCGAEKILMATNGSTLNDSLLRLAIATSEHITPFQVSQLNWSAIHGVPIAEDYRAIRESDLVVFQDPVVAAEFFNTRVQDYRRYTKEQKEQSAIKVWSDVTVYLKHCEH